MRYLTLGLNVVAVVLMLSVAGCVAKHYKVVEPMECLQVCGAKGVSQCSTLSGVILCVKVKQ